MIGTWVLILFLSGGGATPQLDHVYFASKANCQYVRDTIKASNMWKVHINECYATGTPEGR